MKRIIKPILLTLLCLPFFVQINAQCSYSKSRVREWRNNNGVEMAKIRVISHFPETVKVWLYHPDNGEKWKSFDVPGNGNGQLWDGSSKITIGSDWGIMVILYGYETCVSLIGELVKADNGEFAG